MSSLQVDKIGNVKVKHDNGRISFVFRNISEYTTLSCPLVFDGQYQGVAIRNTALIPAREGHVESGKWEIYIPKEIVGDVIISPLFLPQDHKLERNESYFLEIVYKMGKFISSISKIEEIPLGPQLTSIEVHPQQLILNFNSKVFLAHPESITWPSIQSIENQGTDHLILHLLEDLNFIPGLQLNIPKDTFFDLYGNPVDQTNISVIPPYTLPSSIYFWNNFDLWNQNLSAWRPQGNSFNGEQHISIPIQNLNQELSLLWIGQITSWSDCYLLEASYNPEYNIKPAWRLGLSSSEKSLIYSYGEFEVKIPFDQYLNQQINIIIRSSLSSQEIWINGSLLAELDQQSIQNPVVLKIDNIIGNIKEIHLGCSIISPEDIQIIQQYCQQKYGQKE